MYSRREAPFTYSISKLLEIVWYVEKDRTRHQSETVLIPKSNKTCGNAHKSAREQLRLFSEWSVSQQKEVSLLCWKMKKQNQTEGEFLGWRIWSLSLQHVHCISALHVNATDADKEITKEKVQKTRAERDPNSRKKWAHELVNKNHLCVYCRACTHTLTCMHSPACLAAWRAPGGHCQSSASLSRRVRVHFACNSFLSVKLVFLSTF